jgi:hypothetical protein
MYHKMSIPALRALAALNLDDLSPREALEALYRLKLKTAKREG